MRRRACLRRALSSFGERRWAIPAAPALGFFFFFFFALSSSSILPLFMPSLCSLDCNQQACRCTIAEHQQGTLTSLAPTKSGRAGRVHHPQVRLRSVLQVGIKSLQGGESGRQIPSWPPLVGTPLAAQPPRLHQIAVGQVLVL